MADELPFIQIASYAASKTKSIYPSQQSTIYTETSDSCKLWNRLQVEIKKKTERVAKSNKREKTKTK